MIGNKTIKKLGTNVKKNLKQELRDQGHYLTGALENSIIDRYTENSDGAVMDMEALDYIDDVNEGIAPNHIDVNDADYIKGLRQYAVQRFGAKTEKIALRIAFAIARKHKREGMPTQASYAFSKTGERTEAVEISYNEHSKQNEEIIEEGISVELDELINKTFDKTIF